MEEDIRAREARELGQQLAHHVQANRVGEAHALLAPVLSERVPFPLLEILGKPLGAGPPEAASALMDLAADTKAVGAWVVIGSALGVMAGLDLPGALARCRRFVIFADSWYGADILGERVPGPALLAEPRRTIALLGPWRDDPNRWVRRTLGVAVHFWAKRSRGAPPSVPVAEDLLAFLDPLFEERNTDAAGGIAWGLKTMGRHYPDLLTCWLTDQVASRRRTPRAILLRKALTFLPKEQRAQVVRGMPTSPGPPLWAFNK